MHRLSRGTPRRSFALAQCPPQRAIDDPVLRRTFSPRERQRQVVLLAQPILGYAQPRVQPASGHGRNVLERRQHVAQRLDRQPQSVQALGAMVPADAAPDPVRAAIELLEHPADPHLAIHSEPGQRVVQLPGGARAAEPLHDHPSGVEPCPLEQLEQLGPHRARRSVGFRCGVADQGLEYVDFPAVVERPRERLQQASGTPGPRLSEGRRICPQYRPHPPGQHSRPMDVLGPDLSQCRQQRQQFATIGGQDGAQPACTAGPDREPA